MAYNNGNDNGNSHVTEYCVMCRRPDTAAGKMIHMPGNMCVCSDCMQKMMDFAGSMDFSKMTGDPAMTQNLFNMFCGGSPFGIRVYDFDNRRIFLHRGFRRHLLPGLFIRLLLIRLCRRFGRCIF